MLIYQLKNFLNYPLALFASLAIAINKRLLPLCMISLIPHLPLIKALVFLVITLIPLTTTP
jgi:hypothetical protein